MLHESDAEVELPVHCKRAVCASNANVSVEVMIATCVERSGGCSGCR